MNPALPVRVDFTHKGVMVPLSNDTHKLDILRSTPKAVYSHMYSEQEWSSMM